MTDLMTAVVTGAAPRVLQDLLDSGEAVNARVENGWTALLLAGMHTVDTNVLQVLIDAGADVGGQTDEGVSVLHAAAMVNNDAAAELFIKAGADVRARTNSGNTPLLAALGKDGGVEVVQVLLAAGADPNEANFNNETPLILSAAGNGSLEQMGITPQTCRSLRFKPATHSGVNLPGIPMQTCRF